MQPGVWHKEFKPETVQLASGLQSGPSLRKLGIACGRLINQISKGVYAKDSLCGDTGEGPMLLNSCYTLISWSMDFSQALSFFSLANGV